MLTSLMLPEEWGPGRLVLLLKKGDPLVPGNYRPINLTEVMYRVFEEALLVHRAARWIDAIAPPTGARRWWTATRR
jgi:hypothetical protein